ncbi:PASTA domain-containing protein [Paenibacillus sp. YYML68]|uniref:PASTA domain-containing protein n=1 Tax=Paenibacillus sp. YYML68 TaxID=2909250 RepID=UPI002490691E|nr:PASTA domain-containing protein [Paenibacillus sp. YYML68]
MDRILRSRYVVHKPILPLRSGMLYEGTDLSLQRELVLFIHELPGEFEQQSFLRALQAVAHFNDNHFLQLLDVGVEDTSSYAVLKAPSGEPLSLQLSQLSLSVGDAVRCVTELSSGILDALERGIAGYSLIADNVWVNDEGRLLYINYWQKGSEGDVGAAGLASLMYQLTTGSEALPVSAEARELKLLACMKRGAVAEVYVQQIVSLLVRGWNGQETLVSFIVQLQRLKESLSAAHVEPMGEDAGRGSRTAGEEGAARHGEMEAGRAGAEQHEQREAERSSSGTMPIRPSHASAAAAQQSVHSEGEAHAEKPDERTAEFQAVKLTPEERSKSSKELLHKREDEVADVALADEDEGEDENEAPQRVSLLKKALFGFLLAGVAAVTAVSVFLFILEAGANRATPSRLKAAAEANATVTPQEGTAQRKPPAASEGAAPVPKEEQPSREAEAPASVAEGAEVKVPNLVGLKKEEAEKLALSSGVKYQYFLEKNDQPAATVIRQSPEPGATVKKGEQMTFWVSKGS